MSSEPVRAQSVDVARQRLGRYELITELARGGMGVVYLGRLQGIGGFERMFAIKVLHEHLAEKPQIVSMLLNEARLAAQIQHPNVVSTVDAAVSSEGQYYVVMEYIDGFTLCELLEHPTLDAVRRVRLGLRILLDAMAGVDAAHRLCNPCDGTPLGIVHRDVSPTNVLVSLQGTGMIADFGIARAAAQADALPGLIKGTPCYMAPEQLAGAENLDARADVFSLGAVLWEVLTGEQLFYSPAGITGVFALVQCGEILAPSGRNSRIPAVLDAVCMKALERDPDRRYQSTRELCEDLERVGRDYDLIAGAHETADALPALFAEQIERRRASLPAAADLASSGLVAIPETLRTSPPPPADAAVAPVPTAETSTPAGDAGVADAAVATVAASAVAANIDDPDEFASRLRRGPRWLLVAIAASALIGGAVALLWVAVSAPARPAASAAPAEATGSAVVDEPVAPAAAQIELGDDGEASTDDDQLAPEFETVLEPVRDRSRERVRDRVLTSTFDRRGRVRAVRVRSPRAARAATALALPPGIEPFAPTAAPPRADERDPAVLETNPYLMQR